MNDPDTFLANALRKSDPFTERYSGQPTVVSSSPEAARRLFTADPDLFEVPDPEVLAPLVGNNSVLFIVGSRHRAERKLLNPHFHGSRMRAYGQLFRDVTRHQTAGLAVGDTLPTIDATRAISLESIMRAVFGVDSDRLGDFSRALVDLLESFTLPLVFLRWLRRPFHGLGPWDRFVRARTVIDRLIDEQVTQRSEAAKQGRELHDILALLLGARYEDGSAMSRAQVRDELVSLLLAGYETSAVALTWALHHLHREPARAEQLRAELVPLGRDPEPEALAQLPYLTAVCKETLRLHPIVPTLPPRQVREPFEFMGYTLSPGTRVTITTMRLHKRDDIYPAPESFLPERFLNRTFTAFEYMPFGGGPRRCIGNEFALYEMKIVLATLLSDFRFSLANHKPVRNARLGFMVAPSGGVPLTVMATTQAR